MKNDYLLIDKSIVPDYFEKVLEVDDILLKEKKSVQLACDEAGISRSTYYKYKDKIIRPSLASGKRATIVVVFKNDLNNYSNLFLELNKLNILVDRIYQDDPVNGLSTLKLTLNLSKAKLEIINILNNIRELSFIERADLLRME